MSSTSSTIRIVIDGVSEGLRGAATQSAADLLRLKKSADDTDKSVGKLGKTTVKAFASFGAVGNAIPAITGLVTSLATASGALLVLPGAALGAGVALGTLKFATAGFGDAVKAADPKEFAKATENMGKTAIETAKAVRQLKDPLEELRKTAGNQFFTGLTADVKQLGGTYLPILGKQIPLIAGDLGKMADASAKALLAPESVRAVNTVLGETHKVTQDLAPALGNVIAGVLQIGAAGAREFGLFGLSISAATQRFREWATAANESGKIADLIIRGREEFAKWGTLLGNVGSIAKTIFTGLSGGQTDFIANMIKATDAVKVFLASAAGQNGLATLGNILATTAAITRDVFLVALQSVLPIIAASGPAIQQFAGIIGGALVAALSIVGPPLQALGQFLGDNVAVVQVLGPLILGLVVAFKGLSILGSLVLPLAVMVIAMNAVGLATGRLTLALRILQLAAGPIGIILAGVTIALGVFAAANLSSGDAVKVNQEAVDSIKGTLDQYTGAVTSATRAQVAGELSTRTLSDGHTTLADAIRASGISLEDYTNAATGNQDALQKVNRALLDQATAFIENDANLGRWKKTVEDAHVPAEVLALAVIGNDDALKSLTTTYGINAGVAEQLVTSLKAQVGTLDEVGSALGAYNAQLSEAQKQATAAADANRAFGQVLGALKDGLAGLVGGGAPLAIMVDGFKSLSASARDSAKETGNAANAARRRGGRRPQGRAVHAGVPGLLRPGSHRRGQHRAGGEPAGRSDRSDSRGRRHRLPHQRPRRRARPAEPERADRAGASGGAGQGGGADRRGAQEAGRPRHLRHPAAQRRVRGHREHRAGQAEPGRRRRRGGPVGRDDHGGREHQGCGHQDQGLGDPGRRVHRDDDAGRQPQPGHREGPRHGCAGEWLQGHDHPGRQPRPGHRQDQRDGHLRERLQGHRAGAGQHCRRAGRDRPAQGHHLLHAHRADHLHRRCHRPRRHRAGQGWAAHAHGLWWCPDPAQRRQRHRGAAEHVAGHRGQHARPRGLHPARRLGPVDAHPRRGRDPDGPLHRAHGGRRRDGLRWHRGAGGSGDPGVHRQPGADRHRPHRDPHQ
jgi:hypothetical protein